MRNGKKAAAIFLSCCLLGSLTACGTRGLSENTVAEQYERDAGWGMEKAMAEESTAYESDAAMADMAAEGESPASAAAKELTQGDVSATENAEKTLEKKLIRNMDMTLETTEFDGLLSFVEQKVTELGGYIESSSVNGTADSGRRYSYMVIRVPEEKLNEFEEELGNSARVLSRNSSVQDVTLQYSDLAAHIDALRVEQKTLMDMLEKAEDVDTIIIIQNELTNVRYELESYESQMKVMNNQIDYSTVTVSVNEVKTPTVQEKEGFFTRVKHTFNRNIRNIGEGIEDFFVFVLGNIVGIALFLAVAVGVLYVLRLIIRFLFGKGGKRAKREKNKEKNKEKKANEEQIESTQTENTQTENTQTEYKQTEYKQTE